MEIRLKSAQRPRLSCPRRLLPSQGTSCSGIFISGNGGPTAVVGCLLGAEVQNRNQFLLDALVQAGGQ
eukprot:8076356-Pyramimonas_sp.AAC.1